MKEFCDIDDVKEEIKRLPPDEQELAYRYAEILRSVMKIGGEAVLLAYAMVAIEVAETVEEKPH